MISLNCRELILVSITMFKKYKLGFDVWGLLLFLLLMIPTFIRSVFPAPNDILGAESVTGAIDIIASVCRVLTVVALCSFINRERQKMRISPLIIAVLVCCLLYFAGWIFYYNDVINTIIILLLTVSPCLAFLLFAIDRKNLIAVVPALIFTACHLIYGIVNFIA